MLKTTLSSLVLGITMISSSVYAGDDHDHHHEEERIAHYEFEKPTTKLEAVELFNSTKSKIGMTLESKKLSVSELESVHEQSYALEASIDALREMKAFPESLIDDTDEAVQALHYASEKHEADITREWFDKLEVVGKKLN